MLAEADGSADDVQILDEALYQRRLAALRSARCWAPVFGGFRLDASLLAGFDLAAVDAVAGTDGASATTTHDLAVLHGRSVLVLAYLSVGTVESWRHYASAVSASWTLGPVEGWKNEEYVDARREEWRELMVTEARALAASGFDGLYLDNLDVAEMFAHTRPGVIELVVALRSAVPGLLLVIQNGLIIADRVPIDAIAHEDVFSRWDGGYRPSRPEEVADVLPRLRALRDRGLPVFTLDYAEPGSVGAKEALMRSIREEFRAAVSVLELDRLPHATSPCRESEKSSLQGAATSTAPATHRGRGSSSSS